MRFFQDAQLFNFLQSSIFPLLLQKRSTRPQLRVWVPNCSTGEEVFSLAISLLEFLNEWGSNLCLQIFATDPDAKVLNSTRSGKFPESIAQDVSAQRLAKFFVKRENGYQVRKPVRDVCIFAPHKLIGDPPFSRIDLVSARNATRGLQPEQYDRVMSLLHYAINPHGFLLLDSDEESDMQNALFSRIHKALDVFGKNVAEAHNTYTFALRREAIQAFHALAKSEKSAKSGSTKRGEIRLQKELSILRQNLRDMFEEQEQVNAHLQATNEEIISINQELVAVNSELDAAKGELQTAIENLTATLNQLQNELNENLERRRELDGELSGVFSAMDGSVVMLGSDLSIRRFSAKAQHLLKAASTDIGRPISDLQPRILLPDLESVVEEVIETLSLREFQTRDTDDHAYSVRVRPFRGSDNRVDGVMMSFAEM
jgi:chemotaxis methyl-accepting protein methylase/prefoldin subunit 5